jgi:hypothetical protein
MVTGIVAVLAMSVPLLFVPVATMSAPFAGRTVTVIVVLV